MKELKRNKTNKNKLRVGLVLDDTLDKPDGVQAAVLDIGNELTERGHEVHYLVTETKRTDIHSIHSLSGYYSLKFNGNSVRTPKLARKNQIKKLLHDLDLDIIHVQMPHSPLMSNRIVSLADPKIKIFGTFHILPYNLFSKLGNYLLGVILRHNFKKFISFFAVSEPAKIFMKQSFKVDAHVLPNPVNYSYYRSFQKNDSKMTEIVYVGRFDERKGVEYLVRAFANLPEHIRKNTNLTMCGKGPLLEKMKNLSKVLGVTITFPGFVSDKEKAQYLADADIAVFPSVSGESFGIVLAEAMAARSGVTLAGNNPGYASVMAQFSECLFDPKDIEQFSDMLQIFIEDEKKRLSIGKKQHDYVKNFDIKKIVDDLLIRYQQ